MTPTVGGLFRGTMVIAPENCVCAMVTAVGCGRQGHGEEVATHSKATTTVGNIYATTGTG